MVPAPLAAVVLSVLPEALIKEAERPEVSRSRRNEVGFDFRFGQRIRSPLEGVRARRWLLVATAVLERQGLRAARRTLTLEAFLELERAVLSPDEHLECPDCGEFVTRRGLGIHRATNSACRWRRAVAEVQRSWEAGWRDPFNTEGAPLTWVELTSRVRWRKRLCTVAFPRWEAVLLKPAEAIALSAVPGNHRDTGSPVHVGAGPPVARLAVPASGSGIGQGGSSQGGEDHGC